MVGDTFDPKRLDLRNCPVPITSAPSRPRLPQNQPGEWFFHSRIPGRWLERAASLQCSALRVSLAIWHESSMRRSAVVCLPAKVLKRFGIRRLDRGLAELERAGLVKVSRRKGRRPDITIVEPLLD
jgi:hypothetical protein